MGFLRSVVSGSCLGAVLLLGAPAMARDATGTNGMPGRGAGEVVLASLPPDAQRTDTLIRRGGPFPHAKDGAVFFNRERHLPRQNKGYYREYTVRTPGAADRGARRIVCGGREAAAPDACYYTADHYNSFRRIVN